MLTMRSMFLVLALFAFAGPAHAAGGGGEGGGASRDKRITSAESYLPIYGLSTTIMQDYAPAGMIMIDFGLDVPDAALRARAQRMLPRLKDSARAAIAEYAFSRQRAGGAPDAEQIVRMLQRNVDQTLGAPGAKVLLANLMIQRRR